MKKRPQTAAGIDTKKIPEDCIQVGLRVDVDTLDGTQYGIPSLLDLLAEKDIYASFFFSVGPDNMGRHLWRLIKPAFLIKMLRSHAASLYGWSILLRGTFWPGPNIGKRASGRMQEANVSGHETGLHAWDHQLWQAKVENMSHGEIDHQLVLGMKALTKILQQPVSVSAAAGWKATEEVLLEKEKYAFTYNSDCRGSHIFLPVINGQTLKTPQIPVTLPTYDEIIGRNGISDDNYNAHLLSLIKPGQLNVLTIHAEVEGMSRHELFKRFLDLAEQQQIVFTPLGQLLPENINQIPLNKIQLKPIEGREGTVCWQGESILQRKYPNDS